MANLIQQPQQYNFAGNLSDIVLMSDVPVSFSLAGLLDEIYYPDNEGLITIPLRAFFEAHLHAPDLNDIPDSGLPLVPYTFSIDGKEGGTFHVLPGGVANKALDTEVFLYSNFLTWQPQTRRVSYHEPQWLRYVALQACSVKVKAYFAEGDPVTVTLKELAALTQYSLDMNYGRIRGLFDQQPVYYDVWTEAPDRSRLSFVQRYVLREDGDDTEDFFVFENSLGGFDTIRFTGDRKEVAEAESSNAVFDGDTNEYGVDYSKAWLKQTGYIPDERTRLWVLDFFSSSRRYHLADTSLERIFVTKPKLESTAGEVAGYEFTFAYSHQSKYLNIARDELPEQLEIVGPSDELFFLTPRLNEFPLLDPSQDVLIPAQYAYSKHWGTIPASALKGSGSVEGNGIVGQLRVRQPLRLDVTPGNTYISHDAPAITEATPFNRYGNVDQWGHLQEDFHPHGGRDNVDLEAGNITISMDVTAGGNIQTAAFASGPTGVGARIDQAGNGELHSLVLRMFLETPELRKNKISVIGDEFWVTAAGLVESVKEASKLPVYTKAGRQIMGKDGKPWMLNVGKGYVLRFKLEEGDVHTFKKDDILVSKFAQEGGFQTTWFRVKYVLSDKEVFVSALNGYAPQVAMSVARQGNFTDTTRQNSICIDGRNGYMRVLSGVDSTEIRFENIRCQYGNLNGLTVPGIGSLHGYGEYSDNAYKKGVFLMQGGQTVEDFVQKAVNEVAANVEGIVNEMTSNVEGVTNGLRDLQSSLGGLAFKDRVEKSLLGDTIISGGFIKSELIAVDDALVERLIASDAFIAKLTTSEAFIDRLVARAVSTQQGDNPQRVELNRGGGAIRVINADGETTLNINSGERLDNGWTNGGIYLKQRMYDNQLHECHVGADEIEFKRAGYDIRTSVDFNGMLIDSTLNGVMKQAIYYANGIDLPRGAALNMPGVLAAGRVNKKGQTDNQWGCKSCRAYKHNGQTGKYKITHDIGHTNYFIQVTPAVADNTWAKVHAIILEKTASYAVVAIYDSGTSNTGIDTDFEFLIVGDK